MPKRSRSHHRAISRKRIGFQSQDHTKPQSTPSVPWAPAELDAMLGYRTSSSFPFFMAGVVSRCKKLLFKRER